MTAVQRLLALAPLIVLVTACATTRELSEGQQSALVERAAARWEAIEEHDWATAYTYLSPTYRKVFSSDMYARKFSYMVEWELTSVDFLNYDADAAVASVAVRVMSKPTKLTSAASEAIGSVPTRVIENWVLVDGEWWYSANL